MVQSSFIVLFGVLPPTVLMTGLGFGFGASDSQGLVLVGASTNVVPQFYKNGNIGNILKVTGGN